MFEPDQTGLAKRPLVLGRVFCVPAGVRVDYGFPGRAAYWILRLRSGAWTTFADGDREAVALMRRIEDWAQKNCLLLPLTSSTGKRFEEALEEMHQTALF